MMLTSVSSMSAIIGSSSSRTADGFIKAEQNRNSKFEIRKYNGVPGGIRTPNLLIRSQMLYPVELQTQGIIDGRFQIFRFGRDCRSSFSRSAIGNLKSAIKMGWPTGLEPATTRTTIWGSTIEL